MWDIAVMCSLLCVSILVCSDARGRPLGLK